ncbi:MAG: SynChlorMet cassette protein ScmC [Dehalobacter sp.]|nr:SynChlorMet cassette protein ScmC [Dehalobacter sp.]
MSETIGPEGYSLTLADGQQWCIIHEDEASEPIVKRLVSIFGLKADNGNGSTKIIVAKRCFGAEGDIVNDSRSYSRFKDYPRDGWLMVRQDPVRIWHHPDIPDMVCELMDYDKEKLHIENLEYLDFQYMVGTLYPIYQRVIDRGGIIMHSAMMELGGKGVVLAAESGTGKSTCYRRIEKPWRAVTDEEALVVKVGDRYIMHPMPTWKNYYELGMKEASNVQQQIPLHAIFFLERGEKDRAFPVGKGKAALLIYQSSIQLLGKYWLFMSMPEAAAFRKKLLDNACNIAASVPAYTLQATLTGRFWEEMEKALSDK